MAGFSNADFARLAQVADEAEAKGELGGTYTFLDGEYQGTIESATLETSKETKRQMIRYMITFEDGQYEGKTYMANNMLEVEDPKSIAPKISINTLKRLLTEAGIIDLEKASFDEWIEEHSFEKLLLSLEGEEVTFKLTTKGKYQNAYITINQ